MPGGGRPSIGAVPYRPTCPGCQACEALRIPVRDFKPSKSQRRVWKKNEGRLAIHMCLPTVTPRHLEIYNRHKHERGLVQGAADKDLDEETYRLHFIQSRVDTREVRYLLDGILVAFSILDFGRTSCSSVYHCFDPDQAGLSLGVYSVLKEVELCAQLGMEWYYLGLFVEACSHLSYKADYHPHQKRVGGVWVDFRHAHEGSPATD